MFQPYTLPIFQPYLGKNMLSKRIMKYFTNPKELPAGIRNALTTAAVVVGVAVGIAAIFEKPIIKAATDFFSTC
jgi:hypothetical protein